MSNKRQGTMGKHGKRPETKFGDFGILIHLILLGIHFLIYLNGCFGDGNKMIKGLGILSF